MNKVEIKNWGRWRIAWISPANVKAVGECLRAREIDGVGLSAHHGFEGDFSLLDDLPPFAGIVAVYADSFDCSALHRYSWVQFLTIDSQKRPKFDFSEFPSLSDLRIDWQSGDTLPPECSPLESLYLRSYKPRSKDLNLLPAYRSLKKLELVQSGIVGLEGIGKLVALHEVDISYCRSLERLAALGQTSLERLHLEACKRIRDFPELTRCARLRSIRMSSCGNLASLAFLNKLLALEEFRFVKMEVLDGDMAPLLRLKSVGFIDKRNYSHSCAEVEAITGQNS